MSWTPTTVDHGIWGHIQVVIDNTDVTFFRDIPVQMKSMSWAEPFDDSSCVMEFMQITPFEAYGVGDLSWLDKFKSVEIYRIPPGFPGVPKVTMFEGMIVSIDEKTGDDDNSISVLVMGALFQLDFYVRAPQQLVLPIPLDEFFSAQFSPGIRSHLRTQPLIVEGEPTFTTIRTGSWNPTLTGYIQEELSLAIEDDTNIQWTIMMEDNRQPVFRRKTIDTAEWSVAVGGPGVNTNLKFDATQIENVVYGEGSDESGTEWRNADRKGLIGSDAEIGITVYTPVAMDSPSLYFPDEV